MSLLSQVTSGVIQKPHYLLIYGEPGLGKSTFGSMAPNPVFLCTEDGTNNLNIKRLRINSFDNMIGALNELSSTKHDFKTVVIDTLDHFEPMVWDEVLKENKKYNSISKIPYSNGYILALDYWNTFTTSLEKLRTLGINIVLIAHSYTKAHNDPMLDEAYDKHQVKLHHKAASMIIDRVDCVLFVTQKTYASENKTGKMKAYGDGSRIIYTENRPAFVAKNRFNLPFEMPLSWEDFELGCKSQKPKDIASMIKFIEENLDNLDPSIREKARAHFEQNKDNPVVLAQIEDRIKAIISTRTA